MARLQSLSGEIEAIRGAIHDARVSVARAAASFDQIVKADLWASEAGFAGESDRLGVVLDRQKLMEAMIAGFLVRLEETAAAARKAHATSNGVPRDKKALFFLDWRRRRHVSRFNAAMVSGAVRDILAASDTMIGMLGEHRAALGLYFRRSEKNLVQMIARRKQSLANVEDLHRRIRKAELLLRDFQHRLGDAGDRASRNRLAAERAALENEYARMQDMKQQQRGESQTLARCIAIFSDFVDALSSQIAGQNTLINKVVIDAERCILLYRAMTSPPPTPGDADGMDVMAPRNDAIAALRASGLPHIDILLDMSEKDILIGQGIERRKEQSDEAFARQFRPHRHEAMRVGS